MSFNYNTFLSKDAIVEKTEKHVKTAQFVPFPMGTFEYHINLNERGYFYADVRNTSGKTVFTIKAGRELEEGETSIFEDGFMKNIHDMDGLKAHLIQLGIMKPGQKLIDMEPNARASSVPFMPKTAAKKAPSLPIDRKLSDLKYNETPKVSTERELEDFRIDVADTSIEARLDDARTGKGGDMLVEGQLDSSKSKLVQHRNAEAYTGDFNKLDEQRVKSKAAKRESAEPSSKTQDEAKYWEIKSDDGLKLASVDKTSQFGGVGEQYKKQTEKTRAEEVEEKSTTEHFQLAKSLGDICSKFPGEFIIHLSNFLPEEKIKEAILSFDFGDFSFVEGDRSLSGPSVWSGTVKPPASTDSSERMRQAAAASSTSLVKTAWTNEESDNDADISDFDFSDEEDEKQDKNDPSYGELPLENEEEEDDEPTNTIKTPKKEKNEFADVNEAEIDDMLKGFNIDLPKVEEDDAAIEDAMKDPEVTHDVFSETTISDNSTGTPLAMNSVRFDPQGAAFTALFEKNGKVKKQDVLKEVMTFLKQEHPNLPITVDMLDLSRYKDGVITYFAPDEIIDTTPEKDFSKYETEEEEEPVVENDELNQPLTETPEAVADADDAEPTEAPGDTDVIPSTSIPSLSDSSVALPAVDTPVPSTEEDINYDPVTGKWS